MLFGHNASLVLEFPVMFAVMLVGRLVKEDAKREAEHGKKEDVKKGVLARVHLDGMEIPHRIATCALKELSRRKARPVDGSAGFEHVALDLVVVEKGRRDGVDRLQEALRVNRDGTEREKRLLAQTGGLDLFVSPLGSFSGKLCAQIRRLEQRGRKERETRDDAFVLVTGGTGKGPFDRLAVEHVTFLFFKALRAVSPECAFSDCGFGASSGVRKEVSKSLEASFRTSPLRGPSGSRRRRRSTGGSFGEFGKASPYFSLPSFSTVTFLPRAISSFAQ